MSWDTFSDNMNSFLGIVVIFIGLIAIPEIRKKAKYWLIALAICSLMFWFGCDKIKRDNKKDVEADKSKKELNNKIDNLTANRITDSIKHEELLKDLRKINIGIDSLTNKPVLINTTNNNKYETNIKKAETVNIGGK